MIYDPYRKLTKNFTMREVARSQMAARHGINNIPSDCVLERAALLAREVLQPIRNHFGKGFSPSSWYRSEQLEKVVAARGYKTWLNRRGYQDTADHWDEYFARKQHPLGRAADIEIPGVSNDELFAWVKDNLEYDQLIREFPRQDDPMSGWVHVSFSILENRRESFTIG